MVGLLIKFLTHAEMAEIIEILFGGMLVWVQETTCYIGSRSHIVRGNFEVTCFSPSIVKCSDCAAL